jgi:hypothetical protein
MTLGANNKKRTHTPSPGLEAPLGEWLQVDKTLAQPHVPACAPRDESVLYMRVRIEGSKRSAQAWRGPAG